MSISTLKYDCTRTSSVLMSSYQANDYGSRSAAYNYTLFPSRHLPCCVSRGLGLVQSSNQNDGKRESMAPCFNLLTICFTDAKSNRCRFRLQLNTRQRTVLDAPTRLRLSRNITLDTLGFVKQPSLISSTELMQNNYRCAVPLKVDASSSRNVHA
jgi:hypothetical protein